jgi:aminomethyltransferase
MCNSAGGIIDDMVILRAKDEMFFVIFNAANREKDLNWMISRKKDFDVQVENVSETVGLLAVQGPKAKETVQTITKENINIVKRFGCSLLQVTEEKGLISGTGYTGEDGFEISIFDSPVSEPKKALQVWNALIDAGLTNDLKPCGLGARDVLRLEAGMCLYGNELTDKTTPYEARIGFVVKLDKESEFIGRSNLEKQKNVGVERVRVGLKLLKPGVPRKGYSIMQDNKLVGEVTSGTFSPTVQTGICMGYVPKDFSKRSTILQVEIRKKLIDAEAVRFPFYDKTKYGWMRN